MFLSRFSRFRTPAAALFAAPLLASPALAHVGVHDGAQGSFLSGFLHPIFGLDHVLAMLAVGLLAAQLGGRGRIALPAAFVAAMLGGFALALAGVALPAVEPMILASVIVLGVLIGAALRLPLPAAAGLVAVFAVFHGAAHGSEMGAATALPYALGFALATAGLTVLGLLLGLGARAAAPKLGRGLGVLTALAGVYLVLT
ncbi:HupE/UreJ family protein [Stappia sp.]|uniref:HupE/UreJ family protein n=1 Tax=Stappia sp. TaxID=1870903 RepID=UPI0032D96416